VDSNDGAGSVWGDVGVVVRGECGGFAEYISESEEFPDDEFGIYGVEIFAGRICRPEREHRHNEGRAEVGAPFVFGGGVTPEGVS
jgi:hypothetical protein